MNDPSNARPSFPPSAAASPRAASAPVPLAASLAIPSLVAQCWDVAPMPERCRLVEQLLRPLGLLSVAAVAGGVFAQVRLRGGWPDVQVRGSDLHGIGRDHVMALVDHAQQVSVETVDGLAWMLSASPVWSGSAAASVLVALLVQRARARNAPAIAAREVQP